MRQATLLPSRHSRYLTWPVPRGSIAAAAALVCLALAACGSGDNLSPSGTQPAAPSQAPEVRAEATREPPFTGEINGFTFYGRDFNARQLDPPECQRSAPRTGTEAEARGSALSFETAYLPAGAEKVTVTVLVCEATVVHFELNYRTPGGFAYVKREARLPFKPATWSEARLEAATVAGKPAVIARPAEGGAMIFLRDGLSIWTVSGEMTLEEALRVAEGLR